MNPAKKMSFMSACRDFFGLHPGETALQFGQEIKQLTTEDRAEIKEGLEKLGYEIVQAS